MKRVLRFQSTLRRCYSSTNTGPTGTLFQQAQPREVGPSLLHQTAAIQRTFDARSNQGFARIIECVLPRDRANCRNCVQWYTIFRLSPLIAKRR